MNINEQKTIPSWLRLTAILLLAGGGIFVLWSSQVDAGPVSCSGGGAPCPGSAPFTKLGVYQGVISIVPGAVGDSVLEIGNAGRDIAGTGDIFVRPQGATITDLNLYAKFFHGGGGKTALFIPGPLCLGTTNPADCIASWSGVTAANLDVVLTAGNRTTQDIVLGSVGGAGLIPGAGRIDATAQDIGEDAVIGRQNVGGNTKSGVYGENASATGWAGFFSGRLHSSGSVGIGTTAPSAKLHVVTNSDAIDAFRLESVAPATVIRAWLIGPGVGGSVALGIRDATAGANRISISTSGNVGIGTISPSSLLSVGGSSQFQVDTNGNLVRIENVTYDWPNANASGVLTNNGSGALSWALAAAQPLDSVLAAGNRSDKDIVLGSVGGAGLVAGTARVDATATDISEDAVSGKQNVGGNTKSGVYGENASAGGWAGFFSGRLHVSGNVGFGTTGPVIRVAVGDTDTGLHWLGDGLIDLYSNSFSALSARGNTVGIGDTTPDNRFTVGSTSQFQVDTNGNLVRIESVIYDWPNANAGGVLTNNGSGGLSWAPAAVSQNLDEVLGVGNRSDKDIVLGSVGGAGLVAGTARVDATATDISEDSVSGKQNVGGNTKSGVYGENASATGWAGFFSGRLHASGNVGFGTTAPSSRLEVQGNAYGAAFDGIIVGDTTERLLFGYSTTNLDGTVTIAARILQTNYAGTGHGDPRELEIAAPGGAASGIAFLTGSTSTRRVRITNSGSLTVGNPAAANPELFEVNALGDIIRLKNVTYSWPAVNAAGILTNNGSGGLSWAAVGSGSQTLDQVLSLGNITQRDIILSTGTGLGSGAGRLEVRADDISQDAVNIVHPVGGNTKSAIYAENSQPSGWAGYFSGSVFTGETIPNRTANTARLVVNSYYHDPGDPGSTLPPVDCLPGPGTAPCVGSLGDGLAVYSNNWTAAIYAEQQNTAGGAYAGYFSGNVHIQGDLYVTGSCTGCSPFTRFPNYAIAGPIGLLQPLDSLRFGDNLFGSRPEKMILYGNNAPATAFDGLLIGSGKAGAYDFLKLGYTNVTPTNATHSRERASQIFWGAGTNGDTEGSLHIASRGSTRTGISFYTSPDGDGSGIGGTGLVEHLKISGLGNTHIIGASNGLCFGTGTTDCRNTWVGAGASDLNAVLAAGNRSDKDIVLGSVGGAGLVAGTARVDATATDISEDAVSGKQNVGGNTKSGVYGENSSATGWAGFFSGRVSISGQTNLNNVAYTWPGAQGGAGTVLTNNGSGGLSWGAAGGGSLPGGSFGQTLYHDGATWVATSQIYNSGGGQVALLDDTPASRTLSIKASYIPSFGAISIYGSDDTPDADPAEIELFGAQPSLLYPVSGPSIRTITDWAGPGNPSQFGAHRLAFFQHPNDLGYTTQNEVLTISSTGNIGVNHDFTADQPINDDAENANFVIRSWGNAFSTQNRFSQPLNTVSEDTLAIYADSVNSPFGSALYSEQLGSAYAGYFSGPVEIKGRTGLTGPVKSYALNVETVPGGPIKALGVTGAPFAADFSGNVDISGTTFDHGVDWPSGLGRDGSLQVFGSPSVGGRFGVGVYSVVTPGTQFGAAIAGRSTSAASFSYAGYFEGKLGVKGAGSSGPATLVISMIPLTGGSNCSTLCSNSGLTCMIVLPNTAGGTTQACTVNTSGFNCLCRQ